MLPTLSHLFIHMFQNLIHHAAELFSCRWLSLWTLINWIRYLHFHIAVEFAVDFICKCTTLMPWKVVIDGQVNGARGNILAIFCCTPLQNQKLAQSSCHYQTLSCYLCQYMSHMLALEVLIADSFPSSLEYSIAHFLHDVFCLLIFFFMLSVASFIYGLMYFLCFSLHAFIVTNL